MDPHTVQSSFHIAGLKYSVGNLLLSSLRLAILITTEHFPFWVKVVLSTTGLLRIFLAACCKPQQWLFGYGLPAHPWVEPRLWPKCHLAVAGLSNAGHSSHGCTAVFSWPWHRGPSSLPHGTVLFAIFYLVLVGEGSALLLKLRGFVALPAPAGGFEQEPHCTQGKWAGYCPAVEDAVSCQLCRGSGTCLLHLLPLLYSSGKSLIANKIGKDFFLVELPCHLSWLLRSWKSEFGSNTLFSRGVADFPAPVQIGWNAIT